MTEFLEKVAVALVKAIQDDVYCQQKKNPGPAKTCVIDASRARGTLRCCGATCSLPGVRPRVVRATARAGRGLGPVGLRHVPLPVPSHHLVPEKFLPNHAVTAFLAKNPKKKHPEFELESDTSYDTNHALNGYFMPFASTTAQWLATSKAGEQDAICFEMMRRTRRQLHQGRHSHTDYLEEVDNVETAGYKSMVDTLLKVVAKRTLVHYKACPVCKSEGPPYKVQPLEAVVRQMYRVSKTLQGLLHLNRIFVSRRAADYFAKYRQGSILAHPSKPLA
jgi:hypothetical protein